MKTYLAADGSLDVSGPDIVVEVEVRADGKVLWVHVDGITALRISQIPALIVTDHRPVRRSREQP